MTKVRETDTHVYFLGGMLSQWYPCTFKGFLRPSDKATTFNCAEQYMMARKALLFDDYETLEKILKAKTPKEQKEFGRQVQNFDEALWSFSARDIVFYGNWYKFSQNESLKEDLISTGDKTLVEGAKYDKVWGVGLAWNDDAILDSKNWKGKNWLGQTLMEVRFALRETDFADDLERFGSRKLFPVDTD